MPHRMLAVRPDGMIVPFRHRPLIAILDDEPFLRELMAEMFMGLGWDSIAYHHKDEFLIHLSRLSPDVIITDIISPRMDGLKFLAVIKAHRRFHTIPVIISSGWASWAAKQHPAGAFALISKPWKYRRMVRTVRWALRERG